MQFDLTSQVANREKSGCSIVGVYSSRQLTPTARLLDTATGGRLQDAIRAGDMGGEIGKTLLLRDHRGIAADRVLLVGCGKRSGLDPSRYIRILDSAARALADTGSVTSAVYLNEIEVTGRDSDWKMRLIAELFEHRLYRFRRFKTGRQPSLKLRRVHVAKLDDQTRVQARMALAEAAATSAGIRLARDLGNLPGNVCTPSYLADQAKELAVGRDIKVEVLGEREMERLGMGALLSVARGSRQEAKLITLSYGGGGKLDKPIVLVGKGVTFDSGGISIKPAAAMDEMKYDMCGAASVLGVLLAVAELKLPVNLVGVVPSSENLPDGNASKPGDIVTTMSGKTVEILNTDAEGRLLLCDALTYAQRFNPEVLIDIATLTGACVVALGAHASGLLSNDPALAEELVAAGVASHDRVWQLPVWPEYQEQIKSSFADIANVGGREAGTITAACFLARFTEGYRWAHLDIAGTAWSSGKEKSATGRPVALLTRYIIRRATAR